MASPWATWQTPPRAWPMAWTRPTMELEKAAPARRLPLAMAMPGLAILAVFHGAGQILADLLDGLFREGIADGVALETGGRFDGVDQGVEAPWRR